MGCCIKPSWGAPRLDITNPFIFHHITIFLIVTWKTRWALRCDTNHSGIDIWYLNTYFLRWSTGKYMFWIYNSLYDSELKHMMVCSIASCLDCWSFDVVACTRCRPSTVCAIYHFDIFLTHFFGEPITNTLLLLSIKILAQRKGWKLLYNLSKHWSSYSTSAWWYYSVGLL